MYDIHTSNFNPHKRYYLMCGVGYYFGIKLRMAGKNQNQAVQVPPEKDFKIMAKSIKKVRQDAIDYNLNALFVVYNDKSPNEFPPERFLELVPDLPLVVINSQKNLGCGGKENVLQYISNVYADWLFRMDADLELGTSMMHCFKAFNEIKKLFLVAICGGFTAHFIDYANESEFMPNSGQMGGAILVKTKLFAEIGYSDPILRYLDDSDLIHRAYYLGYKTVMSKHTKGMCASSGCGMSRDIRRWYGQYLSSVNKMTRIFFNKKGVPIVRKNTKNYDLLGKLGYNRYIPPSPEALLAVDDLRAGNYKQIERNDGQTEHQQATI